MLDTKHTGKLDFTTFAKGVVGDYSAQMTLQGVRCVAVPVAVPVSVPGLAFVFVVVHLFCWSFLLQVVHFACGWCCVK